MKQDDWVAWWCGLIIGTLGGLAIPPHQLLPCFVGALLGSTIGSIYRYFTKEE